jgi:hypothetical protein
MDLRTKDLLFGLLDAPPHPAPVAAVERRIRRRSHSGLAVVAGTVAAVVATTVAVQYAVDRPSPRPDAVAAEADAGPELGTVPTSERYREQAASQGPVPDRLDLLARYSSAGITFLVAGHVGGGRFCYMVYDDHMEVAGGGGVACGPWPFQRPAVAPAADPTKFFLNRSFSSGRGTATNTVSGTAPRGTRTIVLRTGSHEQRIPVFDSGDHWDHVVFFNAPVDTPHASAVALGDRGQVLARADEG